MKKYIKILVFVWLSCGLPVFAQVDQAALRRVLVAYQAACRQSPEVNLTLQWVKPVRVKDVMLRTPRRGAGDTVIRYDRESTACKGVVVAGAQPRVIIPAVCVENGDYQLDKILLTFTAKRCTAVAHARDVVKQNEVAFVQLHTACTDGINGVTLAAAPQGGSLQDAYGAEMTAALERFFHANHVPAKHRSSCRIGGTMYRSQPTLKIGDVFIFNGKVMALVKRVPKVYRDFWGDVSESSLALIR